MNCSLTCFSVHGIFQARILEWVAISFFRGSSQSKDHWACISCIGRWFLYNWATRKAPIKKLINLNVKKKSHLFYSFYMSSNVTSKRSYPRPSTLSPFFVLFLFRTYLSSVPKTVLNTSCWLNKWMNNWYIIYALLMLKWIKVVLYVSFRGKPVCAYFLS